MVSDTSSNSRKYPSIAASDINCLVAWGEYRDNISNIWGNIDQLVGIDEQKEIVRRDVSVTSTIISGQIRLPEGKDYRIYDISGRAVAPSTMGQGIYFIEVDGQPIKKVVKVR